MKFKGKYILDHSDLQYKLVRLPWKHKILRGLLWISMSGIISLGYISFFQNKFGSPKEKMLQQQIEHMKLNYSILDRKFSDAFKTIHSLEQSDDIRYRPILNMDSIPSSFRNPGYGGVDRYKEFSSLENAAIVVSSHQKLDLVLNMSKIQEESYKAITDRRDEWINEFNHIPRISPVDVEYPLGDGLKLREVHPVWGVPKWHFGQDIDCPYGTNVYATGDGKVITAAYNSTNGFGNYIVIDHSYGFQSVYGHLSKIEVSEGMNVKRGDLIALSGNSGTSTGPHLHYQVDLYGTHQNPLYFFSNDLTHDEYLKMITALSTRTKFR